MGLNYVKQGNAVQPVYDGWKNESGLTVQGTAYEPNGAGGFQQYASGNPISFTEIGTTGRYTAQITASNVNGWHLIMIDATDSGKSRPGVYKFRVQNNEIQEIYDLVSQIDGKVDDIQGVGFVEGTDSLKAQSDRQQDIAGTGFVTGTDSLAALSAALATLQSTVDDIESSVTANVFVESEPDLEIPSSGSTRYKVNIRNYDANGMDDFDAVPSIQVLVNGVDETASRVYDARTGGALTTTMASEGVGTGVYEAFLQLNDTDVASFVNIVITGVNNTETRTFQKNIGFVDPGAAAGAAQEATLTEMKQTTAGTFDRDTDSLEAIRNRLDAIRDQLAGATFNSSTDSLEALRDNQDIIKTKSGGTYNRDNMSLEAIRETVDSAIQFSGLGVH